MSEINPHNKNYPQAALFQAGQKELGADTIQRENLSEVEVRQAGLRRFGKRILASVGVTAAVFGAGEAVGYAIDNSSTTKYQRQIEQQQQTQSSPAELQQVIQAHQAQEQQAQEQSREADGQ